MRDLLKTIMTSSMVAGAALLVSACGGNKDADANNMATDNMAMDPMMDGSTNDVTAIDGAAGTDANMAMDANMTMDANMSGGNTMSNDTMMSNGSDANMTNGM